MALTDGISLCPTSTVSWTDSCTRSYIESLPPFIIAILVLVCLIPFPSSRVGRGLLEPFKPFLTTAEAEALILDDTSGIQERFPKPRAPLWHTICLSGLALAELITWVIFASYQIVVSHGKHTYLTTIYIFRAGSWLPEVILPIFRPKAIAPYDLFALYLLQLLSAFFHFGALWYDLQSDGIKPSFLDLAGDSMNLTVVIISLLVILGMPVAFPNNKAIAKEIVRRFRFI